MARYENGWIKLSRRTVIEDIGDNVFALGLWVMLLSLANWKESKIIWRGKQRILPPGTIVFGYRELAERWECSPNTVKKWAKYLCDTDRIVLEVCTEGCIATICNWEKYQTREEDACTPTAHAVHTLCTPSAHAVHLNEEVQEGKKERIEEEKRPPALSKCGNAWVESLKILGVDRQTVRPDEQTEIFRAIKNHGADTVYLALVGARYQKKTEKWDPKDYPSIHRIIAKDKNGVCKISQYADLALTHMRRPDASGDAGIDEMDREIAQSLARLKNGS